MTSQSEAAPEATPAATAAPPANDLQFLREEEKLARDVYLHLYERWNIQAFSNIAGAEQRHMDRVAMLMPSRNIADPVTDDTVGVFHNETLAGLYADLTEAGDASEVAALRVGATIEDLDIRDIEEMLTRTEDPEILQSYRLLLCGSGNHMRAFSGLLEGRGESYTPQYISAEHYQEILDGEHERCGQIYGGGGHGRGGRGSGGRGSGMGQGMGMGMGQGMGQGMGMGNCGGTNAQLEDGNDA
ncbi:MAG: DUF2202 domain-containing protein [Deltaproteobacteria bacterium]|nr:DUF2202 domain-containing protein [Deltaproteobacteria bacterium]